MSRHRGQKYLKKRGCHPEHRRRVERSGLPTMLRGAPHDSLFRQMSIAGLLPLLKGDIGIICLLSNICRFGIAN